jgi:hypothetical protein
VPKINPNCTAEVRLPIAVAVRPKLITKSVITALLANQREVQQNWATTIIGSIVLYGSLTSLLVGKCYYYYFLLGPILKFSWSCWFNFKEEQN